MSGSYTARPRARRRPFSSVANAEEMTRSPPSATTLQPSPIVSRKPTGTISIPFDSSQRTTSGSVVSGHTAARPGASMHTIRSRWT